MLERFESEAGTLQVTLTNHGMTCGGDRVAEEEELARDLRGAPNIIVKRSAGYANSGRRTLENSGARDGEAWKARQAPSGQCCEDLEFLAH
jgi:hypothetical protein